MLLQLQKEPEKLYKKNLEKKKGNESEYDNNPETILKTNLITRLFNISPNPRQLVKVFLPIELFFSFCFFLFIS